LLTDSTLPMGDGPAGGSKPVITAIIGTLQSPSEQHRGETRQTGTSIWGQTTDAVGRRIGSQPTRLLGCCGIPEASASVSIGRVRVTTEDPVVALIHVMSARGY
jgi:hypothetical protein